MTRYLLNIAVFLMISGAHLLGALEPVERAIRDLRFGLMERDASGSFVIVEIDSRSLRDLNTWPWPRGHHAQLIDKLRAAGAVDIAYDVDFSSKSTPLEDAKLADALRRAGGRVILPAFRQHMKHESGAVSVIESEPLEILARHSQRGLVNISIDSDGLVRRHETHGVWKGLEISSLGAALARVEMPTSSSFLIDFSIRPESVPRLSYVDVLRGRVDPKMISGKSVIVGATAIELGDNFSVPVHTIIPGVMLQVLAYESLVQGRALQRPPPAVTLLIALLIAIGLGPWFAGWSWRKGLGVTLAFEAVVFAAGAVTQWFVPISVDTVPLAMIPLCSYAIGLCRHIDIQEIAIFREHLDAKHRRAMLQSVVDDSFSGIAITNEDGVIELFNRAAEQILGVEASDVIGTPVHSHISSNRAIAELYASLKNRPNETLPVNNLVGPCEFTLPREGREDLEIELLVSSSRLSVTKGRRRGKALDKTVLIYTFRNITERKQLELAQQRAMEEHAAANRAKSEFLANMSHELRTPLNAIIGFSEVMVTETFGPVGAPQYQEYVKDIYASGIHLTDIVNDILDIAKIESGEMTLNESWVNVSDTALSCIRLVKERADNARLRLENKIPNDLPLIRGDERKIKQILFNLLTNSVKFTPEGGAVTVSCELEAEGSLVLSVQDTGIGMELKDIEIALKNFGQVDSRLQRKYEGTGLGLPMVKALASLHGAALEIESEAGVGTTVSVRFPVWRIATELTSGSALAAAE